MDYFKKFFFTTPKAKHEFSSESERIRRTTSTSAAIPETPCTSTFQNWTDIKVLPADSASPTITVLFRENGTLSIAKMWLPNANPHYPNSIQALATEAYVYQHQVPFLLGSLPNSIPRTPCLIASRYVTKCYMSVYDFKKFFERNGDLDNKKIINFKNLRAIEDRFGDDKAYSKNQPQIAKQAIHMIVSEASPGQKLSDWLTEWYLNLQKAARNQVNEIFDALDSIVFQVIWTLTQLHRVCVVHNDLHLDNIFVEKFSQPVTNEYYESWEEQGCGWFFRKTHFRALIYDWDRSAVSRVIGSEEPPFNPLISTEWNPKTKEYLASALCCAGGSCQDFRPNADLYWFVYNVGSVLQKIQAFLSESNSLGSEGKESKAIIDTNMETMLNKLDAIVPGYQRLMKDFGGYENTRPSVVSYRDRKTIMTNESFGVNDPIESVLKTEWRRYFQETPPANISKKYKSISPSEYQCHVEQLDRIETMCTILKPQEMQGGTAYQASPDAKPWPNPRENTPFTCTTKQSPAKRSVPQ